MDEKNKERAEQERKAGLPQKQAGKDNKKGEGEVLPEIQSDGSGGAFSETIEVLKKDEDQRPSAPDQETPY